MLLFRFLPYSDGKNAYLLYFFGIFSFWFWLGILFWLLRMELKKGSHTLLCSCLISKKDTILMY